MSITLTGNNDYLIQQKLHVLRDEFRANYGNSIEQFDGAEAVDIDVVIDAVRSISFLEPQKMVIVRNFSVDKSLFEALPKVVESVADSTKLILVERAIDKRSSVHKFLLKNTEFHDLKELAEYDLVSWLQSEAKKNDSSIDKSLAHYLVSRVGVNQQLLSQEIYKLASAHTHITNKIIDELVEATPQSKVFKLLESLFQGDLNRTIELYKDQRMQGEEPQKIIAMISWQLDQLASAVFAPQKTVSVLSASGMSAYSAQKSLDLSRNISKTQLKFYVSELARIDAMSKTSADVESALEVYFTEVAATV